MANKAAIDFGNCNTVAAVWNDQTQSAEVIHIPEISDQESFLIPSKIAYEPDGRFFIGSQIIRKASLQSREFRWMKRYIGLRSPYSLLVGSERIDARKAAEDFLYTLTAVAFTQKNERPDELIISVPVESFEHYSDWLLNDLKRFENLHLRLIDEASAAAAGYGLNLHPGNTLLLIDFGGSTLQAVCVAVTEAETSDGRCCRVLGKSGCSLGGMTLDRWLFEYVLTRLALAEHDPHVNQCSAALLKYCEMAKMRLSREESVLFDFFPEMPFLLDRKALEDVFRAHGLFDSLNSVIEEALRSAEDHGLKRDELTAVIPVGGSCLIPSIRNSLTERFPESLLVWGEPLGAVARGAAVIAGGMHIYDFIQHAYAIRYTAPSTGEYAFRTIVPKGTEYPAKEVTAPLRLKASFDGQQHFGIAVYEITESSIQTENTSEIFFSTDGSVHVLPLTGEESSAEKRFWMNERNPLFLHADTQTRRGVPQFEITFDINANKMLLINVKNLVSGAQVLSSHPVVRLI